MDNAMNILFTSAGRRVGLLKIFQQTLADLGLAGKVYAMDSRPELSAACQIAHRCFRSPLVQSSDYMPFVESLCDELNVKIVIPLIDPSLIPLSLAREEFRRQGIQIAVSGPELCRIFARKSLSHDFFFQHGFKTPRIYKEIPERAFPVFAKMDESSNSLGVEKVFTAARASELSASQPNYIFQEYLEGEEFTLDVFIDSHGEVIDVVPRQRLEVRAGEVSKGITVRDEELMQETVHLCRRLPDAYGALNIQAFRTTDGIYFTEINPRFGGGFPLSYHAGANMAAYLIRDALGQPLEFQNTWKDRTLMLRFDSEVIRHDANFDSPTADLPAQEETEGSQWS